MPIADELSVVWDTTAVGGSSITIGGSSARQIDSWTIVEQDYEAAAFEFSFITTALTEAAFATEVLALEAAFRRPRGDLTVTQGSTTILSLNHSTSTGFNGSPRIMKQGDMGDTGRSRFYHVRIDFGMPADNVNTSYRRWSTIKVDFSPSRQRTVTINATYTANGSTGSYAQYLATIATYASSVLTGISGTATWEKISEPDVTRDDTDKVTNAVIIYKEKFFQDSIGSTDDLDIVDPVLIFSRGKEAPGDSTAGAPNLAGGGGGSTFSTGTHGVDTGVMVSTGIPNTGTTTSIQRPTILTLTYSCGIDGTRTYNLTGRWNTVIRPFIIKQAALFAEAGVVLINEKPEFDPYYNRINATMEFHVYASGAIIKSRTSAKDATSHGRVFAPTTSKDEYAYYKFPGPAVRLRTISQEYEMVTSETDPNKIVEGLYASPGAKAGNLANADKWELVSRSPEAVSLTKGLPGASTVTIAEIKIETTFQYGNFVSPSVANAGGVTGATVSG